MNSGAVSDNGNSLIEPVYIKNFLTRLEFEPSMDYYPPFGVIAIDPNAGGANEAAFYAMTIINGQRIVRIIFIY